MDLDLIFKIANLVALFGWICLYIGWFFQPLVRVIRWLLPSVLLSGCYLLLAIFYLPSGEGGFGSLESVNLLFKNKTILLAGWIHYLAYDLLIGTWAFLDAKKLEISFIWMFPIFFFMFMLGPIGFLFYWILRSIKIKSISI